MIVTTGPGVEGRSITEYLDLVTSQAIMGIRVTKDIKSIGANIMGGRVSGFEDEVQKAIIDVKRELVEAARATRSRRCRRRRHRPREHEQHPARDGERDRDQAQLRSRSEAGTPPPPTHASGRRRSCA